MSIKSTYLFIKSILIIGTICLFLPFYFRKDFADREFVTRVGDNVYITNSHQRLLAEQKAFQDTLSNAYILNTHIDQGGCIGGADPTKLSKRDLLIEFIKGPCSPIVLIPGLYASKLTVQIDCMTLKNERPEIFQACGWTSCSGYKFWESKPEPNYLLWISEFRSPMAIVFDDTVKCWGQLIELEFDPNQKNESMKFKSPPGVNVTVFGENKFTTNEQDCGFGATNNLLPAFYQTRMTDGYHELSEQLTAMGYQKGLTLFATPYDWRMTTLRTKLYDKISRSVEQAYKLTSKKVILLAHSYGNFGTLNYLNRLPIEKKKKMIEQYVLVTAPLGGVPKATKNPIAGDTEFVWFEWGVNFYGQKKVVSKQGAVIDLQLPNSISQFKEETWMKDVIKRMNVEKQYDINTIQGKKEWSQLLRNHNYTYQWFPTPLTECFQNFVFRPRSCGLFFYDWETEPLMMIQGQNFKGDQIGRDALFDQYVTMTPKEYYGHFKEDSKKNKISDLENPEVPVTLIFGSHTKTPKNFVYDYNPLKASLKDQFAFPNKTIYTQGDGTVTTASALLPALKWSWEYDFKHAGGKIQNAQPVKTVEYCASFNIRENPYDDMESDKPFKYSKNEYIGLACDCQGSGPTDGKDCEHPDIINDRKFVSFVLKICKTNNRVWDVRDTLAYQLSNAELTTISQFCPAVNLDHDVFEFFVNKFEVQYSQETNQMD